MKKITFSLFFIYSVLSTGVELESIWTPDFTKEVRLTCDEENSFDCYYMCRDWKKCVYKEEVCDNCVSNNPLMTHLFTYMGREYINTGVEADSIEVTEFLESGMFISISSRSIYNLIEPLDSFKLRRRFQSLCEDETEYPVVLFEKTELNELDEVKFVSCKSGIYEMEATSDVISDFGALY